MTVSNYHAEFETIKKILRTNPRGLTITEIAKNIGANRNSTAKYLDLMMISGIIEQRNVGRAKLFYLSQRIPVYALLDYSSDIVIVLNQEKVVTQINQNFEKVYKTPRDALIGRKVSSFLDRTEYTELYDLIMESEFEEITVGINERHFRIKKIPTVFNDGTYGDTILMHDVTDEQIAIKALELIDKRAHDFIRSSTSGMVLTDENLRVIEVNEAALKISGLSRDEVMGSTILGYAKNSVDSEKYREFIELLNQNKPIIIKELTLPEEYGGKTIMLNLFPAGSGVGIIITETDE
jgi:PAS domain S-box-containing protein